MTTRRKYDVWNRLRRVESLSTATGASRVSFDSPGARMAKMPGECVAEYGVGLELHVLPPQIPALNPDELLWNAFFDSSPIGMNQLAGEEHSGIVNDQNIAFYSDHSLCWLQATTIPDRDHRFQQWIEI